MEDSSLLQSPVSAIMQGAFPFVDANAKLEDVSKQINKENNAVLVKDEDGNNHIITSHDIINAIR